MENCILTLFNMYYFSLKALNKNVLWVNIDKEAINESYLRLHIPTSSFHSNNVRTNNFSWCQFGRQQTIAKAWAL